MEFILHIGIAQFAFAALVVLTKRDRHLSDLLLGYWLILMDIFLLLTLFKNIYPETIFGNLQMFPFFFTIGPFFYLYVKTLAKANPKFETADTLHALPFVIYSTAAVATDSPVDEDILKGLSFEIENLAYSIPAGISAVVYTLLTVRELRRHRERLLDHFSYTSHKITLNWLRIVVIGFSVTLLITMISAIALVFSELINPGIILFLGMVLFAFAVSYFGIRQPAIYRESGKRMDDRFAGDLEEEVEKEREKEKKPEKAAPVVEEVVEEVEENSNGKNEKYARSSLTPEQALGYSEALIKYMEEAQPYLRRDLNIQEVAGELDIPQHHLTQTINEFLDKNFYTLVNEYRIEEVKKRLLDPKFDHFTLLAIAHDAGFNSKSAFNMIFKNYTGMTPSQYRKKFKTEFKEK